MAQDVARGEARLDAHSIEQIPEADRDSTGWQQFWIWAGANIAPINWILGALGIVLGLGLMETILVIVLGNIVGCAIFASLTVMGHKTGVNQMVLSRSPFGRRGGYLSSWMQFLMTMGWIGVNTYFPVVLAVAILGHFGVSGTFVVKFIVVTVIMIIQVGIGVYGFYLIRSFEKYTVPVVFGIMALMSILAWTRHGIVNWGLTSHLTGAAHFSAISGLVTAIGVGWAISWVTWASDYSRFVKPERVVQGRVLVQLRRPVRAHRVAGHPRCQHRQRGPVRGPGQAGVLGLRRGGRRPGHAAGPARADRHQHPQRLLLRAGRPVGRHQAPAAGCWG